MFKKNCEHWWQYTDILPFDTLIDFWCNEQDSCREVKRMALVSALNKGAVKYQRTDGKTWEDPPLQLIQKGALAIERSSFEVWLEEIEEPNPLPLPEQKEHKKNELDSSEYWRSFTAKIHKAISDYPQWSQTQPKISKSKNLHFWLKENCGMDERECELAKKVVTDIYDIT